MKKIFALLLVAMLLSASSALAFKQQEIQADGTVAAGETISVLSNKVTLEYLGGPLKYAAITGHDAGSKIYGSSSDSTKIYSQVSDPVTVEAPGASDSSEFSSGWTAL